MHKSASVVMARCLRFCIGLSTALAVFLVLLQFITMMSGGEKKMFVIKSGSMSPTIEKGSLVISAKHDEYGPSDVVTFTTDNGPVTHRIKEGAQNKYITQGDANNVEDPKAITKDQIIGAVEFSVPYLGYVLQLTKQPVGFTCLVLMPLFMLLIIESASVLADLRKKRYVAA